MLLLTGCSPNSCRTPLVYDMNSGRQEIFKVSSDNSRYSRIRFRNGIHNTPRGITNNVNVLESSESACLVGLTLLPIS